MANELDKQLDYVDGDITKDEADAPAYTPVYQMMADSKIPVSKRLGPFWERRMKEGVEHLKQSKAKDRWDEAIKYYQNDQGGTRNRRAHLAEVGSGRSNEEFFSTENIIFANVSALVPVVYAKNPEVEIIADIEGQEGKAEMHEKLIDTLFSRKVSPGLNLKPKMRRAVVMTMLTNLSYLELSYVKKDDSSEAVVDDILRLSEELRKAKDVKEIAEIEGKLIALDEKVNLLSESGPRLRVRAPHTVIVDPASEEVDLSDAQYVIVEDYLRTEFLRAVYGSKDPKTGEWKPLYAPTHVLQNSGKADISGHDEEINNFTLLGDGEQDYQKYGYTNEEDYRDACRTKVWMVWDKTTRRVMMFHDKDWCYPIWVWDDPYRLSRFFPFFPLTFYTDPVQRYARSEVMYYLDQQDEINRSNNERARMRHWVLSKVFVNTSILKDVQKVEKFLTGQTNDTVYGIELPDNTKISDAIGTLPAPSTQFEGLFDTQPILQSINRLSSVTPILQNEQFKTNTTNKAIETYESSTQTRLDEKIDAIEDILGDIGNALMEMCVQFMPEEQVRQLIGDKIVDDAGAWDIDMTPQQLHEIYSFRIVGGSTLKPTSKVKKEQAIQLAQVLGQFASAAPASVFVMLKAIQRAFSEDFVISREEWKMLVQGVMSAMQSQAAPSPNGGGRPTNGGGAEPAQQNAEVGIEEAFNALEQLIGNLDPQLKAQVGEAIAQGVPLKRIVQQLTAQ